MPKLIKLTGPKSYTLLPIGNEPVKKGEVVRCDEDLAQRLLENGRINADKQFVPHWTEVADDTPVDYDLVSREQAPITAPAKIAAVVASSTLVRTSQRAKPIGRSPVIRRTASAT